MSVKAICQAHGASTVEFLAQADGIGSAFRPRGVDFAHTAEAPLHVLDAVERISGDFFVDDNEKAEPTSQHLSQTGAMLGSGSNAPRLPRVKYRNNLVDHVNGDLSR